MSQANAASPPPPTPSPARSPTVAIIGMEGAGKTVLVTTLAKRLSTIDARGIFLNPQGVKTLKYVEQVWSTLQSGEWPPSTPPGEMFELQWKLQIVGELDCDVRLIDAAGQDLRMLFGDDQIKEIASLPRHLQALAEYCRSADIILFLINLKDFLGEGNAEHRVANEAAIKAAMDYLATDGVRRRVCLVLTQTDLYRDLAQDRGGWLELAAEAVPYVFSAHIRVGQVAVHPISAVADTRVVVQGNGTPRRVPVAGFRSDGFDEIVAWLTTQVREVKRQLEVAAAPAAQQTAAIQVADSPASPTRTTSRLRGFLIALAVISVSAALLRGIVPGCSSTSPVPTTVSSRATPDPGVIDDGVIVSGTIRNDGAAGKIRVIAWVVENGAEVERQSRDFYLGPGQTADFSFQMDKIASLSNPWKAFVDTAVP